MKTCKKCGGTVYYNNRQCKACSDAASSRWKRAHKEKSRAWSKAWDDANRERKKESATKRLEIYPERVRESQRKWREKNPEKIREYTRKWIEANAERAAAVRKAWVSKNAEKVNEYSVKWRSLNQEKHKAATKRWGEANQELLRIYRHDRRARKIAVGGKLSKGLVDRLFKLQRGKCACCGLPLGGSYHLDHIMPLVLGGPNTDSNIQLLRQSCNSQKCAKHPVDFMQERGFLL